MLCHELMKTDLECASLRETIESVAVRMRDANIGFLPVCDDEGRVRGAVTDRDIVVRLVANDMPARTPAGAVMTHQLVACRPGDDLQRAEHLMRRAQVSRIMCIDEVGVLAGVISLSDIAQVEGGMQTAQTLREISGREARA